MFDGRATQVGTAWRPDKLKEMTYTQFWRLIQQRQIDRVHTRASPVNHTSNILWRTYN